MLNRELIQLFPSEHLLDVMARYHIKTGGKGLRGKVALAEASVLGVCENKAWQWALACELLHNATLVHDDIQDNDPIRRGRPSVWKKFGLAQAINLGDYLIFRSFRVANSLNQSWLVTQLAEVSEQLVKGQANELLLPSERGFACWNSYIEMTRLKTGALFLLPPLGIHHMSAQPMTDKQQQSWLDLGVCYQIYDDIRDYMGFKQAGQIKKDLKEKKVNALIARLSIKKGYDDLIKIYHNLDTGHPSYDNLIKEIEEAIEETKLIEDLEHEARQFLDQFIKNSFKDTRKIIFEYMNTAINKGDINNVRL